MTLPAQSRYRGKKKGTNHDLETKRQAAILYLTYGTSIEVSKRLGIPDGTVRTWKRTEWWTELQNSLKQEHHDKLNANYNRIIDKSAQLIEKQLENQEIKALDVAKIHGIIFDKRQILNMRPTTINANATKINQLQEQFDRFLQAKEVEVEIVKDE